MVALSTTPTAFETMPQTMYLIDSIASDDATLTLNYVPLAMTAGVLILDENTPREERISFNGILDNGDGTADYQNLGRGLGYGGGTAYAAGATTAYEHTANSSTARLVIAHEYLNKMVVTDRNSLLASGIEMRFGNASNKIYGNGTDLYFASLTTAAKSLSELAAAAGTDEKVKASITDTTRNYLTDKMTGGDGIVKTLNGGGGDETLDFAVDLASDPGLEISSTKLRVKVKANGGVTRDADGLSISNFTYGTGSDGALNVTSGTTTIDCGSLPVVTKNYTSINVSVGATLAFSNVPDSGVLVILLSQGNVTIAGTINLSAGGSIGGIAVTLPGTGNADAQGTVGTEAYNNVGQTRKGSAGAGTHVNDASSGGTGGTGGLNSNSLTAGLAAAAAANGLTVGPGAGGGVGGLGRSITSYVSGSFTATAGPAGRGGGGLFIACGGNWTFTGTINLSGTDATASAAPSGSATQYSVSAGGSGGGASGTGCAVVAGSIVDNSGTTTVTGGAKSVGVKAESGDTGSVTDGTDGATGFFVVFKAY